MTGARGEDGYTLVEILIGIFVLGLVVAALTSLFTTGNNASLAAQRQVNLVAIAQKQIEALRETAAHGNFDAVAMSAAPAGGTAAALAANPTNPDDFVSADHAYFKVQNNYNGTAEGTQFTEPLFINASNGQTAPLKTVTAGSGTATVYTYVTETSTVGTCGTGCDKDTLRIVVAVKLVNPNGRSNIGPNAPTYTTSYLTRPIPTKQNNNGSGLRVGVNIP